MEVSRLVTLVTEHRLAGKRRRSRSDARSSRKSLCLSTFPLVVIASRSTWARACDRVCTKRAYPVGGARVIRCSTNGGKKENRLSERRAGGIILSSGKLAGESTRTGSTDRS